MGIERLDVPHCLITTRESTIAEIYMRGDTSVWFIFPQLRGLGYSHMATAFGIASRQEAEAYLAHQILGRRLRECTDLVNLVEGRSINQLFGYPDDLKFRSSMTLFAGITLDNHVFKDALQKYFAGQPDHLTSERL